MLYHTAGSDTIFVQIYMDELPGVPGVSKNSEKYAKNKTVEFLRKYCPKKDKKLRFIMQSGLYYKKIFWVPKSAVYKRERFQIKSGL